MIGQIDLDEKAIHNTSNMIRKYAINRQNMYKVLF